MGKAKQNAGSNISNLILPKSTEVMGAKKIKRKYSASPAHIKNERKRIITTMQASQR